MQLEQVVVRSPQTASRVIDGEAVVLTADDGTFRVLNRTGTRIWVLLQDRRHVRELVTTIHREFQVEEEQAQADVIAFLKTLETKGIVVIEPPEGPGA